MRPISRIAIANRGEAATRCVRAIRELRIEERTDLVGIALYSDEDRLAPFVRQADEAYAIGPARRISSSGESKLGYLDIDFLLETLERVRADTLWPGWGFLAESPEFVERLRERGITFLGPAPDTMRRLGDKIESKRIASAAGAPVVPWSDGPITRETLGPCAQRIGFPVVLKATAGGGGRGIRIVHRALDLEAAFESASSEAESAFGDGTLFMEARVAAARHIEAQMAADQHGRVLALGLRDCSVQRKHQKLIEEGPPCRLPGELAAEIERSSVRLLERVGYVGVATCEYLVNDDGRFYFLEVNPRLQVEHGVTELVNGMDLVKTQIRIARGERLPETAPPARGAAIEVRLCAEDPAHGFAPSPGRIALLDLPEGPGIRVDAGVAAGTSIPSEFDSMIAKVLAHGATRSEARARMVRALLETRIVVEGGMTNKGFLLDVLGHADFEAGQIKTQWLDDFKVAAEPAPVIDALLVAAIHAYQEDRAGLRQQFFAEAARGRPLSTPPSAGVSIDLAYAGVLHRLHVFALGGWTYRIHAGDRLRQVTLLEQGPHSRALISRERRLQVLVSGSPLEIQVELEGQVHRIQRDTGGRVRASSPCLLVELAVKAGDRVAVGDRLGLFEAMKCETSFHSSVPGVVREVLAHPGDRLRAGDVILVIEPSADTPPESRDQTLLFASESDPLELFIGADQSVSMERAGAAPAHERAAALDALGGEVRRILMGYDVHEERASQLIALLDSPLGKAGSALHTELAQLLRHLSLFASLEVLFSRTAPRVQGEDFSPSNDAWMVLYLRRIAAQGAGIDPAFLERLRVALRHYGFDSIEPSERLHRAVLRLYSTRTTSALRDRLITALLNLTIRLAESADVFEGAELLREPLDHLWQLRGTVSETVADLSAQARFMLFDRRASTVPESSRPGELSLTQLAVPPETNLSAYGERLGLSAEDAARFELWRLANFDLERIAVPNFLGVIALFGRAKGSSGDHRYFCFAEVSELGPDAPENPDLSLFERRFHAAVEAMRWVQAHHAGARRLHWNRITLFVRTPVALGERNVALTLKRMAPETRHLGLERVLVRVALCDAEATERGSRPADLIAWN
ncbi:MAG TPA: biotin carboxylase N-terminal domain-containing protein, partial [Polyangiaceae bacterium]|nr:biotin carboxylase N-terminal domain-containing protein [Polyangiaceae bacterium]